MSEVTSEQILAVKDVKLSIHIKMLEGSNKLELRESISSVCSGKKPKHKYDVNMDH